MAQPLFVNVPEGFDMGVFAQKIAETYQAKGYTVQPAVSGDTAMITISKGIGGINTITGLGESISLNCSVSDNKLIVNYTNEEWTSKIIACVVGWFCCLIPFITGIVGIVRQVNLPKNISADAMLLASQSVL